MAEKDSLPGKKEFVESLIEKGSVLLHIDPRKKGVLVPPWLSKQPQLVLQIGYNMVIPIPDLLIDESGISATLSFNRSAFACYVPWAAVFAIVGDDGRGISWPEDLPPEIVAEIEREIARAQIRSASKSDQPAAHGSADKESPGVTEVASDKPRAAERPKRRSGRTPSKPQPVVAAVPASVEPAARKVEAETPHVAPRERLSKPAAAKPSVGPKGKRVGVRSKPPRPLPPYLRVIK